MIYYTISCGHERAYMPELPVMLPASSWARQGLRAPRLPGHITERAADSGGYVATRRWGGYRYGPGEYVAWLRTFGPAWAATMDFCCEPEIAADPAAVRDRQHRTTEMAWRIWRGYRDTPWCWVPTVQGWSVEDYIRHAAELAPLVEEMQAHYGRDSAWRVGIGTLCRRADAAMVRSVACVVAAALPGAPLHLWGVKASVLRAHVELPNVVSADTAAWNGRWGRAIERQRASGLSESRYDYQVALPGYAARMDRALAGPRQRLLLATGA